MVKRSRLNDEGYKISSHVGGYINKQGMEYWED